MGVFSFNRSHHSGKLFPDISLMQSATLGQLFYTIDIQNDLQPLPKRKPNSVTSGLFPN